MGSEGSDGDVALEHDSMHDARGHAVVVHGVVHGAAVVPDHHVAGRPCVAIAEVRALAVRMQEAGGRAVERSLTLPVKADGPRIGIKPEFDGDLGENSVGNFHVIVVDANGQKQAMQGLTWKLLSVERNYQWYRDGSSWKYEPIISTKQVAVGTVNATTDGAAISMPVTWGRYRLEVSTADANGPESSVEFNAGWYVAASSTETPDALEIALDKDSYAAGEVAKLKVSPHFAGELLVTIGAEKLLKTDMLTRS